MENTEAKKNKNGLKIFLCIFIPLLVIVISAVLFFFLRPVDLYTVTSANYNTFDLTQTIKYSYDETGRLSSVIVDGKERYHYSYINDYKTVTIEDKLDNTEKIIKFNDNFDIIEKIYSDGTKETFSYNEKGKLISSVNANGVKTTYYYDGKRLIAEDYSNGDRIEYEYAGKRIASEVIYSVSGQVYPTYYHYNDNKTLALKDMVFDGISYEYDNKKRVISQTNNAGVSMGFAYDEHGNITSITYPAPATIEYTYTKFEFSEEVYKQNKSLITYNDVIEDESYELLK